MVVRVTETLRSRPDQSAINHLAKFYDRRAARLGFAESTVVYLP